MTTPSSSIETFRNVATLKDGVRVLFRPLITDDANGLLKLFAPLDEEERAAIRGDVDEDLIKGWLEHLDYERLLPIVAEVRHEIIGEGIVHYGKGPYRHTAEVRVFLAKAWRQRGVGTYLLQTLIDIARRQGIHILTAEILASQTHIIKAFGSHGFEVKGTLDDYFMLPGGRTQDVVIMLNPLISHHNEF
ncbi:MAG: GNAT family N-acetyltransferase [Anaerolineae bacterium]|nr:GNAT family N-acetyltransferase [Anaerolineae bacterium]